MIVSFSGGKNSTAMLIELKRRGIPIEGIVFADTGAELPETYEFILRVEEWAKQRIDVVRHPLNWFDWFYRKFEKGNHIGEIHGFPVMFSPKGKSGGWCTRSLKINPLDKYALGRTMAVGIAADEYHRTFRNTQRYPKVYPLCDWRLTSLDCYNICVENDLLNPIYHRVGRSGCWTCPMQSVRQLRILYALYPALWGTLLQLEKDSPSCFRTEVKLAELHELFALQLGSSVPQLGVKAMQAASEPVCEACGGEPEWGSGFFYDNLDGTPGPLIEKEAKRTRFLCAEHKEAFAKWAYDHQEVMDTLADHIGLSRYKRWQEIFDMFLKDARGS